MDDNIILKISFVTCLLGIAIIVIISDKLELKESRINEINENMAEKNIKIKGYANPSRSNKIIQIIEVKDNTGQIEVIAYKGHIKVKKGDIIEVEGSVSKYENKLQVNADTVKVLS